MPEQFTTKGLRVQPLISQFMGRTSFPHYLKHRTAGKGLTADVVLESESQLRVGDHVTLAMIQADTSVYEVVERTEPRKARGDWGAYEVHPLWAQVELRFAGQFKNL